MRQDPSTELVSTICLMYHTSRPCIITVHKLILREHCYRVGTNRLMGYHIPSRLQLQTSALRQPDQGPNNLLDNHIPCLHRHRNLLNNRDMALPEHRSPSKQASRSCHTTRLMPRRPRHVLRPPRAQQPPTLIHLPAPTSQRLHNNPDLELCRASPAGMLLPPPFSQEPSLRIFKQSTPMAPLRRLSSRP